MNAKNLKGETPLHDAARENKNLEIAKFLISAGADPKSADNAGLTPLDKAAKNPNAEVKAYFEGL